MEQSNLYGKVPAVLACAYGFVRADKPYGAVFPGGIC
jgi:hypothetical protein